jgi:hypothetical protein
VRRGETLHVVLHLLDIAFAMTARVDLLRKAGDRDAQIIGVLGEQRLGLAQHI